MEGVYFNSKSFKVEKKTYPLLLLQLVLVYSRPAYLKMQWYR
jgi:hypothetical protein